jgi:hypothetical protein
VNCWDWVVLVLGEQASLASAVLLVLLSIAVAVDVYEDGRNDGLRYHKGR